LLAIAILMIVCLLVSACGKNKTDETDKNELPVMEIQTENFVFPTNKVDYVNSTINFYDGNAQYTFNDKDAGVRLRGNSTMGLLKKPFRIKFDKKISIMGLPENKDWALLADYLDPSLMKNYTALTLAKKLNMGWTPSAFHINLYFNGEYLGVYLLCEQINEDKGRLDLKTANDYTAGQSEYPFLIEIDGSMSVGAEYGIDPNDVFTIESFTDYKRFYGFPAEIKYPEYEDGRTDYATVYIIWYVNAVFGALSNGDLDTFTAMVDIDSFIDYILLNELFGNGDADSHNIFISKRNSEKMRFGPIWDFDLSCARFTDGRSDPEYSNITDIVTFLGESEYAINFFLAMGEQEYKKLTDRYFEIEYVITIYLGEIGNIKNKLTAAAAENDKLWYYDTAAYIGDILDSWYVGSNFNTEIPLTNGYGFAEDFNLTVWWLNGHKNYLHNLCLLSYNEVIKFMESLEIK
jgi:hypothetical protein